MNNDVYNLFISVAHKNKVIANEMWRKAGIFCSPRLLLDIAEHEGITQKELSKISGITPASVTATLDKLENLDYICRKNDTKDLRIKRIYISENGYNIIKKADKVKEEINSFAFNNFTEAEKEVFTNLLLKLEKNLEVLNLD